VVVVDDGGIKGIEKCVANRCEAYALSSGVGLYDVAVGRGLISYLFDVMYCQLSYFNIDTTLW